MKKLLFMWMALWYAASISAFTMDPKYPLPPQSGIDNTAFTEIVDDNKEFYAVNPQNKEAVAVWEDLFSDGLDWYDNEVHLATEIDHGRYEVVAVYVLRWNISLPAADWVRSVYLPATARYVVMLDIPGMEKVSIPEGIEWLGGFRLFAGEDLQLPCSVRELQYNFLAFAENLRSLNLNEVETIGWSTLYGCKSIESLDLGSRLKVLSSGSFSHLTSLSDVTIPESVEAIEDYVFSDCASLKSIALPSHPVAMGEAFTNLSALQSVILPCTTPYEIPEGAFAGVNQEKCVVYVPKGCAAEYENCPGWSRFRISEDSPARTAAVEEENVPAVYYDLTGRRLISPASGQMVICRRGGTVTKMVIP